jgi:hypothetical protein
MTAPSEEVTQLLIAWSNGSQDALDRLMPLVYAELRQMAKRYMSRQREGHTPKPPRSSTKPSSNSSINRTSARRGSCERFSGGHHHEA